MDHGREGGRAFARGADRTLRKYARVLRQVISWHGSSHTVGFKHQHELLGMPMWLVTSSAAPQIQHVANNAAGCCATELNRY